MSVRDDRAFLEDIAERIQLTQEFVQPGKEKFMESRLIQEAVIRNLEIIGEASRNVSQGLRDKNPQIPWRQIGAFRNFVIHVYWAIKLERIWEIIEKDLSPLQPQIEALILELGQSDENTSQDVED